ncbi:hypothetical protein DBV15_05144 [Temnothorax longispinosus]|uniref:Uncharacterized protein n=1 Tax=Temnothorax longispinosus TaxID=300112 RepID=A0A4S2KZE1_9HYME|nr:hypothetical protein DBV15_05144 [Temnothorax longispinosus]
MVFKEYPWSRRECRSRIPGEAPASSRVSKTIIALVPTVRHIEYKRGARFGITFAANVFGVASTPRVTVQATHVAVVRSHLSWSHLLFPAA